MLKSGQKHLESLKDGRVVYIGSELITDVTEHPAFRNGARTVARLFDIKAAAANAETMSFEENGERFSIYYLRPRSRDDLVRRMLGHKFWADATYGLFGRSPDHVASFITALAMQPEVFEDGGHDFKGNLLRYYDHIRRDDVYCCYAVLPPQGARNPQLYQRANMKVPTLRVTAEDVHGVTLNGMKMLGTGGVFCNDIWVGNLLPLAPGQEMESITCAVPANAKGLSMWSRKPYERDATSEFDNPLASRFDETDVMVLFEDVKVPWEKVFTHNNVALSREIYIKTASHCFGNHQSNVRFWSKLRFIIGLASKMTQSSGNDQIPAVRETLGRLANYEGALAGMIYGQCMNYETLTNGYVSFNRRYMYGALQWCTQTYWEIINTVRELMGGGVFQMPADSSIVKDPHLARQFNYYWSTPTQTAIQRMKLLKLVWDMVGSEFASRHFQYEKFYSGPPFILSNHGIREAPWAELQGIVDDLMRTYDI
ncbi:MAG: 4-hydroxyphenylacetate 3-hydroxylase family protein [Alphaproteobacteria bacterium]